VSLFDIEEFEFVRSLFIVPEPLLVPFECSVIAEPGPVLADPVGLVPPTPRGPAGFCVGSLALEPEFIEPVDEPAVPELVVPERIESEDVLERVDPLVPFEYPLVEPDRSAEFIVVEPLSLPIGWV